MNDFASRAPVSGERALVLGGGGSTGNAWLIGVVAGLCEAGLDVTTADRIIGTSAGATAAAQITGAPPARLLADIVSADPPTRPGPVGAGGGSAPGRTAANPMERMAAILAASRDAADLRRRMGASALELDAASDGSWPARWRDTVASRLPDPQWPRQEV
ncbi:MAG: patatin-like phospholipase family protein, partial [Myxococcota bacterium]